MQKNNLIFLDIETTGLDPKTNRISCIGLLSDAGIAQFSDLDENNLIAQYETKMEKFTTEDYTLITYNGKAFDIPFIAERKRILQKTNQPENIQHIDLHEIIQQNYSEGKLIRKDQVCRDFNIFIPKIIGAKTCAIYYDAFLDGADAYILNDIFFHNACDLIATSCLYRKCLELGWIE